MGRNKILIADDVELNRALLRQLFEDKYEILEAADGAETLQYVVDYHDEIAILLLDVIMPDVDGVYVLKEMAGSGYIKNIPVILITGSEDEQLERMGYDLGASDIIRKPFDAYIVKKRVKNILDLYKHKNSLEDLVNVQMKKIDEQTKKIRETNDFLIDTLSTAVEFRDSESGSHIKRIKLFTKILLKYMKNKYPEYNITPAQIDKITSASAMHDIGKIAISDNILLKPGRLTDEEFAIMKSHTVRGCDILQKLDRIDDAEFYQYCYDICRSHHERADGRGYPDGLTEKEIPISAKVVSIADVYDALTSDRVYKKAYSHEKAIDMIINNECGKFSDDLLESLMGVQEQFRECQIQNRDKF